MLGAQSSEAMIGAPGDRHPDKRKTEDGGWGRAAAHAGAGRPPVGVESGGPGPRRDRTNFLFCRVIGVGAWRVTEGRGGGLALPGPLGGGGGGGDSASTLRPRDGLLMGPGAPRGVVTRGQGLSEPLSASVFSPVKWVLGLTAQALGSVGWGQASLRRSVLGTGLGRR